MRYLSDSWEAETNVASFADNTFFFLTPEGVLLVTSLTFLHSTFNLNFKIQLYETLLPSSNYTRFSFVIDLILLVNFRFILVMLLIVLWSFYMLI